VPFYNPREVPVEPEVGGRPDGRGPPGGEVRGREWSGPGWGEGGPAVQFWAAGREKERRKRGEEMGQLG